MSDNAVPLIVAVDGATGYVGSHLVQKLCREGASVRAIVHPRAKDDDCRFLESCGATLYRTEISSTATLLRQALEGADCLVHLIGSIAPPRGQKLEDLHAGQTGQLIAACKNLPLKVVMITALGTAADAGNRYHSSKWQAEELLRQSGLPFVILRPSLIVGRVSGRRDSKLMARYITLIKSRPRVPLLGGGQNLLQPIFIADLVEAIRKAISESNLNGRTLELGGAEVLSMKELLSRLMETLQIRKPLLAIPPPLAAIAASVMEKVQTVPLLSGDQVKLSLQDNVCSENAMDRILNLEMAALSTALNTYKQEPGQEQPARTQSGARSKQ